MNAVGAPSLRKLRLYERKSFAAPIAATLYSESVARRGSALGSL